MGTTAPLQGEGKKKSERTLNDAPNTFSIIAQLKNTLHDYIIVYFIDGGVRRHRAAENKRPVSLLMA